MKLIGSKMTVKSVLPVDDFCLKYTHFVLFFVLIYYSDYDSSSTLYKPTESRMIGKAFTSVTFGKFYCLILCNYDFSSLWGIQLNSIAEHQNNIHLML